MDIDEDDDFYAPEEPDVHPTATGAASASSTTTALKPEPANDELEEGEEEDESGEMDEDDDSEIDIITERKDGSQPAPPSQSRYSEIRNIPQRSTSNDATVKAAPPKKEEVRKASMSGADLPAMSTSKVDVNVIPVHKTTGKPITQVNIDDDLPENGKPWRKPGTDLSDYFNYGFDEFTWSLYAQKQEALRGEYNQDAVAQNNKKMFEDMTNMMMMGGMMPGMPGGTGATGSSAAGAGGPAMPGMDGMPPEMQAMMQQMMSSGMDPSQMDPSAMSAMFAGMQNPGAAGGAGAQGAQGQNFGAGFGGNQGQGYGYDQQGMGGGRGNFGGGRGRGGRRNWQ